METPTNPVRFRSAACADLGAVLVVGHIAHVVHLVLDAPVPPDPSGQQPWWCGLGGKGADRVDHLGAPRCGTADASFASDLDDLFGVRKTQPSCHGGDLVAPLLIAPMPVFGGLVPHHWDLRPGLGLDAGVQPGLVGLDDHHVVRATRRAQQPGGRLLRVHGIHADHPAGDVEALQKRSHSRNLVGL